MLRKYQRARLDATSVKLEVQPKTGEKDIESLPLY